MMACSLKDPTKITDQEMVEHLIDKIHNKGFPNVVTVESQNVFGIWF